MDRRTFIKAVPAFTVLAGATSGFGRENSAGSAAALETIKLAAPETDGGKSVLAALKERKTNRDISDKELSTQMLSNLLWAAFGINRESGTVRGRAGRTAASASNSQEIDLYVALPKGVYIYDAAGHSLNPVPHPDF